MLAKLRLTGHKVSGRIRVGGCGAKGGGYEVEARRGGGEKKLKGENMGIREWEYRRWWVYGCKHTWVWVWGRRYGGIGLREWVRMGQDVVVGARRGCGNVGVYV